MSTLIVLGGGMFLALCAALATAQLGHLDTREDA